MAGSEEPPDCHLKRIKARTRPHPLGMQKKLSIEIRSIYKVTMELSPPVVKRRLVTRMT